MPAVVERSARAGRALLIAAMLLAPVPAARAAGNADFDRVATRAVNDWLARRPALATELGLHTHDQRLDPVTEASVAGDLQWLTALAAELDAISPATLDAVRSADRERLLGWAAAQRFELEVQRPYSHDPGAAVRASERAIRVLLEAETLHPCDRMRAATLRLRRVPEVLRSARVMLEQPHAPAVTAAIGAAGEALDFLRVTLPALTRDCRESVPQADLAEADTAAVRALESYRVALREDVLPRAVAPHGLGSESLARLLRTAEHETAPPESLLRGTEREIAWRRARLDSLAAVVAPGASAADAARVIERDAIPDGTLPAVIAAQLDSLRAGATGRLTLPDARHLEIRWTLIPGRERPAVRLMAAGPLERARGRAVLTYESAGAIASASAHASRDALLSAAALPWALASEALPGRWPLIAARPKWTRVRQVFPAASASEGWCASAEDLAGEWGLAGSGARAEFAAERRALVRLARAAAAFEIHLGGASDEEAATRIAERALLAPANALREAGAARGDPAAAIAPVLGAWRIAQLRETCRVRLGARFSERAFRDAVLAQGPLPLPLAEAGVWRALERGGRSR